MRTFSNQQNGSNQQFAAGYVVYMMGGSYFKNCVCKSPFEEKRLYLNYAELSNQKQIEMEEKVLGRFEELDKNLLEKFEELKCEVSFRQEEKDFFVEFRTGGFETLKCRIKERGEVEFVDLPIMKEADQRCKVERLR